MQELTPQQMKILERLFVAGFRPIAIPPYEKALCVRRGECAVVLIRRAGKEVFVWKKKDLEATAERLRELDAFRQELSEILEMPSRQ